MTVDLTNFLACVGALSALLAVLVGYALLSNLVCDYLWRSIVKRRGIVELSKALKAYNKQQPSAEGDANE